MAFKPETAVNSSARKEHLFKILVIGDKYTGKTSYIKRYVNNTFSDKYKATIGVDFALKVVNWKDSTIVRLQLWDIAGEERFGSMTRVYYKDAIGCLLFYDVTRRPTFDNAIKWKEDLDSKVRLPNGERIPCVLVGSKSDELEGRCRGCEDGNMKQFCESHGFVGWYEVSSLTSHNVDVSATFLIEEVLKVTDSLSSAGRTAETLEQSIVLEPSNPGNTQKRSKCC